MTVRLLALLFVQTYPATNPTFFEHFIALLRTHSASATVSSSPPPLNPQTSDFVLRLLHEISTEISDAHLRLNRPHGRLAKDTELRDAVREKDAAVIASTIWEIIAESLEGVDQDDPSNGTLGLKGKSAREACEMAVRVAGDYVCECRAKTARA